MLRRILFGSIMLVAVLIIIIGLQQLREKEQRRRRAPKEPAPLAARDAGGIELRKYDKDNNLIAIIRGRQARQISEKGPVDIVKPVVTLFRDKTTFTIITADNGSVEGREQDRMQEGVLTNNVVITVLDRAREDNTVITCDEVRFYGEKGQLFIPRQVKATNRTLDLTGVTLTADQGAGTVRIDRDVQLTLKEMSGGAFDRATGETAAGEPAGAPRPIVITCEGALLFESEFRRATFHREVRAVQGDNRVRSDLMIVEFDKAAAAPATEPVEEAPVAPAAPKAAGFDIRRVVMTSDRKEGVVVEGPNRQGWGDRFEYDARDGMLVYSGSPCRASQKSANQTFQLEGAQIQFGRKRLLSQAEVLPEGMTENSQKVLVTGKPARVVSVPAEAGEPMALVGDRILFDQDARVAWIEGAPDRRAVATQGKSRIEGVSLLMSEKTATRGEKVSAKGPGRLETAGRAREDGRQAAPSTVEFAGDMTYRPEAPALPFGGAEFTGGVTFSDGATTCVSRTLDVEFGEGKKGGSREVRRVTARGDVVVTGQKMDAKADVLIYGYPAGEATGATATLTSKPGATCEARQGDLFCRAERIDVIEPAVGSRAGMRAKALGAGVIQYRPAPREGDASGSQPFDVAFTRSGAFDDDALRAAFDGDVRLTRAGMDLRARQIVLDFVRKPVEGAPAKGASQLSVTTITAVQDVTLLEGKEPDVLTATGERLVWDREKGKAELVGGEGAPARVVRDRNELTAPRMDASLKNDAIDQIVTTGGGQMTGYTQTSLGKTARAAPAAPGKLQKLVVTWEGEGFYEALEPRDPANNPTAFMRVKDNARAVGEDSDCSADTLMVYMGPPKPAEGAPAETPEKAGDSGSLKLEIRKAVASGNARAKAFNPDGSYYRYARGDTLEWDRLTNRMVVSSKKGDAVVWDNSNEWVGTQLVVNRTIEGKYEADSTSGRRITFYEEGTPKLPTDEEDAKKWKPIY